MPVQTRSHRFEILYPETHQPLSSLTHPGHLYPRGTLKSGLREIPFYQPIGRYQLRETAAVSIYSRPRSTDDDGSCEIHLVKASGPHYIPGDMEIWPIYHRAVNEVLHRYPEAAQAAVEACLRIRREYTGRKFRRLAARVTASVTRPIPANPLPKGCFLHSEDEQQSCALLGEYLHATAPSTATNATSSPKPSTPNGASSAIGSPKAPNSKSPSPETKPPTVRNSPAPIAPPTSPMPSPNRRTSSKISASCKRNANLLLTTLHQTNPSQHPREYNGSPNEPTAPTTSQPSPNEAKPTTKPTVNSSKTAATAWVLESSLSGGRIGEANISRKQSWGSRQRATRA
jgi:hypothetical protein